MIKWALFHLGRAPFLWMYVYRGMGLKMYMGK